MSGDVDGAPGVRRAPADGNHGASAARARAITRFAPIYTLPRLPTSTLVTIPCQVDRAGSSFALTSSECKFLLLTPICAPQDEGRRATSGEVAAAESGTMLQQTQEEFAAITEKVRPCYCSPVGCPETLLTPSVVNVNNPMLYNLIEPPYSNSLSS